MNRVLAQLAFLFFGITTTALSQQTTTRPVLVELFTSEGCSDCPPADALLRSISAAHTPAGAPIVVLSEHVTYWNYLGWNDPFSLDAVTARQEDYARRFHREGPYTPQMVVDGTAEFVGSDRNTLERALRQHDQQQPAATLAINTVTRDAEHVTLTYTTTGDLHRGVLYAAFSDDLDTRDVRRGENSGRTLTHIAVVRTLTALAPPTTAGPQTLALTVPTNLNNAGHHITLFVQESNLGRVLAADTHTF